MSAVAPLAVVIPFLAAAFAAGGKRLPTAAADVVAIGAAVATGLVVLMTSFVEEALQRRLRRPR